LWLAARSDSKNRPKPSLAPLPTCASRPIASSAIWDEGTGDPQEAGDGLGFVRSPLLSRPALHRLPPQLAGLVGKRLPLPGEGGPVGLHRRVVPASQSLNPACQPGSTVSKKRSRAPRPSIADENASNAQSQSLPHWRNGPTRPRASCRANPSLPPPSATCAGVAPPSAVALTTVAWRSTTARPSA